MTEPVRARLFAAACGALFVFGIVLALLGTLFGLPEMRERLQVDLAGQGNLFLLLFAGLFFATLLVGPLIDRFGNRWILIVSSLMVTVAMLGLSAAWSFGTAAAAVFLLGLGGAGINTAANALVSSLYPESRGRMLNILGIFFGFGALFIPLLAAALAGLFSIDQLLYVAAALSGACLLACAALPFPAAIGAGRFSLGSILRVARYPGVLLFAMLLFFQSGNEAAISGWTSTYVGDRGWDPRTATWVLAGYWGALMLGRLLSARLVTRVGGARLILGSGVASVVGCLALFASNSIPAIAAAAILTGFAFSAIYPTTLAMAGDRYQQSAGTVFGLLFAIALIGGMIFPWGVGHVAQTFGVRSGMLLPVGGTIMICVMILAIGAREARREARPLSIGSLGH